MSEQRAWMATWSDESGTIRLSVDFDHEQEARQFVTQSPLTLRLWRAEPMGEPHGFIPDDPASALPLCRLCGGSPMTAFHRPSTTPTMEEA